MGATIKGADGKLRCKWCDAAPEFLGYHDTEWGFPVSWPLISDQESRNSGIFCW